MISRISTISSPVKPNFLRSSTSFLNSSFLNLSILLPAFKIFTAFAARLQPRPLSSECSQNRGSCKARLTTPYSESCTGIAEKSQGENRPPLSILAKKSGRIKLPHLCSRIFPTLDFWSACAFETAVYAKRGRKSWKMEAIRILKSRTKSTAE